MTSLLKSAAVCGSGMSIEFRFVTEVFDQLLQFRIFCQVHILRHEAIIMFSLLRMFLGVLDRLIYPSCFRWGLDMQLLHSFNGRHEMFGKRALETTLYLLERHRYNVSIESRRKIILLAILVFVVFADLG